MQEPQINPWSSTPSLDIEKTFADFGIDPIAPVLSELPEVPYFMRRGIVVGHRDYRPIAQAIRNKTPFHILTGFMPSGHPHLGHLMVMKEVVWHVQQGGNGYITIADREAHDVWTRSFPLAPGGRLVLGNVNGAVSVEAVFAWPGLGTLILDSISNLDFTVVQAAVTFLALVFTGINLLVDIVYSFVDPRIRYGS